jgi:hypothetical protein
MGPYTNRQAPPAGTERLAHNGLSSAPIKNHEPHDPIGLRLFDDLVKRTDRVADLVGAFGWLTVGLDRDHQVIGGDPDIKRPIAEGLAFIEPLCAERPKDPVTVARTTRPLRPEP